MEPLLKADKWSSVDWEATPIEYRAIILIVPRLLLTVARDI